jgi:hypothetical protein
MDYVGGCSLARSPENQTKIETWQADQTTKSEFFRQKLHDYGLLEVAYAIEAVQGENLLWDLPALGITDRAWSRVVHRGIKPLRVFAHPDILSTIHRSVGYYQKLALVSLKSMDRIGLRVTSFDSGVNRHQMNTQTAMDVARRLNELISRLIEAESNLDARVFDVWRGMTAGSTAQGSWQNRKGKIAEDIVKGIVRQRLRDHQSEVADRSSEAADLLTDGRTIRYGSEPDIALYSDTGTILAAVEVKGGIDTAGVLERIGAALKSLSRAKYESPHAITMLIMYRVSMTEQARQELDAHRSEIDYWFTLEDVLNRDAIRQRIFELLAI